MQYLLQLRFDLVPLFPFEKTCPDEKVGYETWCKHGLIYPDTGQKSCVGSAI